MNCAEFEQGLVEVMAGELPAGERTRGLQRLRAHAGDCGECEGSADLLDWLELPAPEREIADDPGPGYWAGFNERLERRLDVPARRGRAGLWWAIAAAAALLLLIAGPGLLRQIRPVTPTETASNLPLETPEAYEIPEAPEMPDELVGMLASASLDELGEAMPWVASSSSQDDEPVLGEPIGRPAGLLPDAAGLDDEARGELLQWLREQAQGVSS